MAQGQAVCARSTASVQDGPGATHRRAEMVLDGGTIEVAEDSLFIDCSADGLARHDLPLFSPGRVTLQPVFICQQTHSARR